MFGIPISVDASWLIILALVTWSLAVQVFPQEPALAGLSRSTFWLMGLVTALAYFICILLHELGHSVVGRALGMPVRGITLFLFGGVSELGAEPASAGSEFLMAVAGPLVSAVLAIIFWIVQAVASQSGWWPPLVVVLYWLAWINTVVLLFNLVPAFPLDGGRVLRSILWGLQGNLRRATRWACYLGQGFAWLMIAAAVMFVFVAGDLVGGIWLGLIGLFLNNAAKSSYQQVIVRQALQGEPVRRFMNREPIVVPSALDLRHWVEDYVYRYHRKTFPVAADGHLEGFITTQDLAVYPRDEWDRHTVGEVMRRDFAGVTIRPDADALQALGQMQRTGFSRLLVTEGEHLVGIVSLKDLLRFLHLKIELEQGNEDTPAVPRP